MVKLKKKRDIKKLRFSRLKIETKVENWDKIGTKLKVGTKSGRNVKLKKNEKNVKLSCTKITTSSYFSIGTSRIKLYVPFCTQLTRETFTEFLIAFFFILILPRDFVKSKEFLNE